MTKLNDALKRTRLAALMGLVKYAPTADGHDRYLLGADDVTLSLRWLCQYGFLVLSRVGPEHTAFEAGTRPVR